MSILFLNYFQVFSLFIQIHLNLFQIYYNMLI
nr:MAG TPA_asm: hypothetical protein [Caudoviricetes sp.]